MSKRILAILMAMAMAFSLLPVTAFAVDGEAGAATGADVVNGYYNNNNQWVRGEQKRSDGLQDTVTTVNKTATKVADNQYKVTLEVQMKYKSTEVLPGAAATVLVIDTSGSMNDKTQCEKEEHTHSDTCYTWETCTPENHPKHYYEWGGEYNHKWTTSCTWDGSKYVYLHLTCNKEEHRHDNCGSTTRIEAAKVAAKNFLNSYRGGTVSEDGGWTPSATPLNRYVSIVSFNTGVSKNNWVDVSTQAGYNEAIASIDLSPGGGTNLDAGLRMANAQLNNNTVQDMPANVVVLTDGKPTYHLEKAEKQNKQSDVEIEGVQYSVKGKGYETSTATYNQTVSTAATLKQAASVYTVCFGASSETLGVQGNPTVSEFLRTNIATQAEGKTYAYDANDTTDLYKAFAAISSSLVSGLNTGTVTDALPNGVSCVTNGTNGIFDQDSNLTWQLDPEEATKSEPDREGFITYTYQKMYTVQIDPTEEKLNVVNGYVPLNLPTTLTVKDSTNQDVTIPFPIPAGKVTYSLTEFNKELVTKSDTPTFTIPEGITLPEKVDSTVLVGEDGVTLLYKITVNGDKGAKFTVTDTGATLVSPKGDSITIDARNSTFSGIVGANGTVFYVSKNFTTNDITTNGETKSISNVAKIAPGDNATGPEKTEKTVTTTVKKPEPATYTLTYDANDGDGDSVPTDNNNYTAGAKVKLNYTTKPTHEQVSGKDVIFIGWSETKDDTIYDKGDTIPTLIQSVNMTANKTVYAVWGYDTIGKNNKPDSVPDVFNAVVTYKIENGTWDGTNACATEVIKVRTFATNTNEWIVTNNKLSHIPDTTKVTPSEGYTSSGTWDKYTPTTDTIVTADVTYTYTLAYKQPAQTGSLTVTKQVTGLTLNELPANFKIKVTNAENDTQKLLLTDNSVTENETNKTLTWTISNLAPGAYTVSEENADVNGYTYTATYDNGATGQANSPTVTVTEGKTSTMNVKNTYTKNATVDLSSLIKKELKIEDGSTLPANATFDVTVTPATVNSQNVENPQPISGTASVSESSPKTEDTYTVPFDFKDGGTLSLPAGTYTYTVQETKGDISGMQYDSNAYTLTIEVENSIAAVKYTTGRASTTTGVSTKNPLTIKNTYQTPDLNVTKQPYKVNDTDFKSGETVAHVGDTIVWKIDVKNNRSTEAFTTLQETLTRATVYSDADCSDKTTLNDDGTWTATVSAEQTATYYVTYTVTASDIPKGKIVNAIVKDSDDEHPINSDPVPTWDTKQLKSAESLTKDTSGNWTTTVTLTLPTVEAVEVEGTEPSANVAITSGSYVIDEIGENFIFMEGLSLKVGVSGTEGTTELACTQDTTDNNCYHFGTKDDNGYPYTVTYIDQDGNTPAQFKWDINESVPAGTTVTLSYKLKLTSPKTAAGTYGVEDLNGKGGFDESKALYTNESAILHDVDNIELAVFPKPSVSYTISSGSSGGHSSSSKPTLNTKDHYGFVVGYPDGTVQPEGKITRAEVATIYFRMLTDESRTKFWSQSNEYSDVEAGDWFNNAVSTLSNAGIISGYEDGTFRPNGYITRAEFATIAARFFDAAYNGEDLFPDISGHWAKDYINQAANKGFVNGYEDGTFKPNQNITRAEAVTLVNRTLDRHPDKSHFTKDMLTWPDNQDETKWYYADMQEATNSHTYESKENSDKSKYENWTKTLSIRNWAALEKEWSNANSSQGTGNVV